MYKKVQFDSGLTACTHSVITFFFFAEIHHFVVFRRDSSSNKAFSFEEQKPDHLQMESLQHFNLLLRFFVFVFTWFGLASFSAPKTESTKTKISHSKQTQSSVQVVFQSDL